MGGLLLCGKPGLRGCQCLGDAMARGSADHVVAVEDGIELERSIDSGIGFGGEALKVFDGEVFEFAAARKAVAHGAADLLVCIAEGHATMSEVGGGGHGVHEATRC